MTGSTIIRGGDDTANANDVNELLVVAGKAKLYSVKCYNGNIAARWLQIFNAATAPTDSTVVPLIVLPLAASDGGELNFPEGRIFTAGIYFCTAVLDVLNVKGAADAIFDATYEIL